MKKTLLYGADDWGSDDEPETPFPPREKKLRKLKEIHNNGTLLLIGFACGYLFRSYLN